jgi:tetratricopeptide (TPR) repeat protein
MFSEVASFNRQTNEGGSITTNRSSGLELQEGKARLAFDYLGIARRSQGKLAEAETALERAAWSMAWYAPTNQALAELACQRSDFAKALELIDRSLTGNRSRSAADAAALYRQFL